jgi:hypothetical protein
MKLFAPEVIHKPHLFPAGSAISPSNIQDLICCRFSIIPGGLPTRAASLIEVESALLLNCEYYSI